MQLKLDNSFSCMGLFRMAADSIEMLKCGTFNGMPTFLIISLTVPHFNIALSNRQPYESFPETSEFSLKFQKYRAGETTHSFVLKKMYCSYIHDASVRIQQFVMHFLRFNFLFSSQPLIVVQPQLFFSKISCES